MIIASGATFAFLVSVFSTALCRLAGVVSEVPLRACFDTSWIWFSVHSFARR